MTPHEELDAHYAEYWETLKLDADSNETPKHEAFFERFALTAHQNGDCGELEYHHIRDPDGTRYGADGYALDVENGELNIAICDFRDEPLLETLPQGRIDTLYKRVERFVAIADDPGFLQELDETSEAYQVVQPIQQYSALIKRVRVILFSNARLVSRKSGVQTKNISGRKFVYNLLDFKRYMDIELAGEGAEPVTIDLEDMEEQPIPCLRAHRVGGKYESFLLTMRGGLLAELYERHGARLLEQNVRSYLQARNKVNKGILATLQDEPGMFFAYNNGITATAAEVHKSKAKAGGHEITGFRNLQIVNGGQTTASLLYARDQLKVDLDAVYVQVKLSVIDETELDQVVGSIAKFSNSQSKVSASDFFSQHPFHLEMEKISKRVSAPQREDMFTATKWYYERARGQYRNETSYLTKPQKDRFWAEFPKDQKIDKTELAIYENTYLCLPDTVCKGAGKNFEKFAGRIDVEWAKNSKHFHDEYFKQLIGRVILFRRTDRLVSQSDWYRENRGWKRNTVVYTVAWLVNYLQSQRMELDLMKLWSQQDVSEELAGVLLQVAKKVAAEVRNTPAGVANIGEYCKQQACWAAVKRLTISVGRRLDTDIIDQAEANQRTREQRATGRLASEVDLDLLVANWFAEGKVAGIRAKADELGILSPKSDRLLKKIERGDINLTKSERRVIEFLIKALRERGVDCE